LAKARITHAALLAAAALLIVLFFVRLLRSPGGGDDTGGDNVVASAPPPDARSTSPSRPIQVITAPPTPAADPARNDLECPPAKPADGARCRVPETTVQNCPYGEGAKEIICVCDGSAGAGAVWRCAAPVADVPQPPCPAAEPAAGEACSYAGQTCFYGRASPDETPKTTCNCRPGKDRRWACVPTSELRRLE
jgi:hypothetical protein